MNLDDIIKDSYEQEAAKIMKNQHKSTEELDYIFNYADRKQSNIYGKVLKIFSKSLSYIPIGDVVGVLIFIFIFFALPNIIAQNRQSYTTNFISNLSGQSNTTETNKSDSNKLSAGSNGSIEKVTIKSLSITLADSKDLTNNVNVKSNYPNLYPYVVNFEDVKNVINELKRLGAIEISINGQQVSERSEISPEGQFLKINNNKYKGPFIFKAEWNKNISVDNLLKDNDIINNLKTRGLEVNIEY